MNTPIKYIPPVTDFVMVSKGDLSFSVVERLMTIKLFDIDYKDPVYDDERELPDLEHRHNIDPEALNANMAQSCIVVEAPVMFSTQECEKYDYIDDFPAYRFYSARITMDILPMSVIVNDRM